MILPVVILPFLCGITSALVHGLDTSSLLSQDTYTKTLGDGFSHLVLNGYEEGCLLGGHVNSNLVANYKNAKAAGYKNIDVSWAPCTGTLNHCKPYSAQLAELTKAIQGNGLTVGRIWLNLEKSTLCNGWNYGASGNLAEAKKLLNALKSSGKGFGIYSSPSEWSNIFGSRGAVLDPSAPLWFATFDDQESLELRAPFGGWTKAFGKQYSDQAAGNYDLNVFAS